jgi:hypothetical protein
MSAKIETDANGVEHAITWWVWAGGEKMRHTAQMRGQWGWDASCTCGWESRTGGATRGSVQRDVDDHKWDYRNVAETDAAVAEFMAMTPDEKLAYLTKAAQR